MNPFALMHVDRGIATGRRTSILIADTNVEPTSPLVERLVCDGFHVCLAGGVDAVKRHLRERTFSFAITELVFDDGDGLTNVEALAAANRGCRILVHSHFCSVAKAVRAIKAGASDVLPKPVDVDFVLAVLFNNNLRRTSSEVSLPEPNSIRDEHIRNVYLSCGANVSDAARRLSMHRRTLQRILKRSALR